MVEKADCYITKFGSIHKTEKSALEREQEEEMDDFSTKVCDQHNVAAWGYWYEFGQNLYRERKALLELLSTYRFIDNLELTDTQHEEGN